jgi:hypothetical protein
MTVTSASFPLLGGAPRRTGDFARAAYYCGYLAAWAETV